MPCTTKLAAEQIAGLRHDAVDVRIQQRKIGFAAEGAHVVDDVAGAVDLPADFHGQLGERLRRDGLAAAGLAQKIACRALMTVSGWFSSWATPVAISPSVASFRPE